jgi:hypothetical protein
MEYLFSILAAIGLVAFFMIWLNNKANQVRTQNMELVRSYLVKMREVHRIKERTHHYTMPRWPIWPRPVLYEKIDMDTQLAFARLTQSIATAQSEQCHVQPVTSERIPIGSLHVQFLIFWKYNENLQRWNYLLQIQENIQQFLEVIEENLKRVVATQDEVAKKVTELVKELNENMQKLPGIQRMGNQVESAIIQGQIELASYFVSEAQKSLLNCNSEDGIEYARAHLSCRGTMVMLDCYTAGFVQFSYPANVELDYTAQLTESLNLFIRNSIPAISIQGWKSLMQINEGLLKAEIILKKIRVSLKDFETEYNSYRERVKSLESINYDDQINRAMDAETQLSKYWGTIAESPDVWTDVLGEKERPSEGLVELRKKLQKEIGPMLRPENIIKQSHMQYILGKLDEAINEYKHFELVVRRIQKHIREQKDAEDQVFKKIGEGGEARIAVNQITALRDDTTKEINKEINQAIDKFNRLCDRAENPKGARYPMLLADLAIFISECKKIKQKHEREIAVVENQAAAFSRQARTLYEQVSYLAQRTPHVDVNLTNITNKFNDNSELHKTAGSSYNGLITYIKKSEGLVGDFERTISSIKEQFHKYETFKKEIQVAIKLKQEEILSFMVKMGMDWGKPLYNHQQTLVKFSQSLSTSLTELDRADTLTSLSQATEYCEAIQKTLGSQAHSISVEMQNMQKELSLLLKKDQELQYMFDHAFELKLRDLPAARNIREKAKDQSDFDKACVFLDRAMTILQTGGDTNIDIHDIHDSSVNVATQGNISNQHISTKGGFS